MVEQSAAKGGEREGNGVAAVCWGRGGDSVVHEFYVALPSLTERTTRNWDEKTRSPQLGNPKQTRPYTDRRDGVCDLPTRVQILSHRLAIFTVELRGLPQFLQANVGTVLQICPLSRTFNIASGIPANNSNVQTVRYITYKHYSILILIGITKWT